MVLLLAELADFLNEGVGMLEGVELEGLGESIEVVFFIPALYSTLFDDVSDFSLVHFLKVVYTFLIINLKLLVQLLHPSIGEWESLLHFSKRCSL